MDMPIGIILYSTLVLVVEFHDTPRPRAVLLKCLKNYSAIRNSAEDPLWSSGHDTRLPNGSTRVRIRGSANAFEPNRIRDHEPSTPGESCGSSTR